MSASNGYGHVSVTVLDGTPAGKRKALHDAHIKGVSENLQKKIPIAEASIWNAIEAATQKPAEKPRRCVKVGSARQRTPEFYVLWKAASRFFPWQTEHMPGSHGIDDVYLVVPDLGKLYDDSVDSVDGNGKGKKKQLTRTASWWWKEFIEFGGSTTDEADKRRVTRNIDSYIKYESIFTKAIETKSASFEKSIFEVIEKIVALQLHEIPREINIGTASDAYDYEILAEVASRFFPWQAESGKDGRTMFLIMPNLSELDFDIDLMDALDGKRQIITAGDWYSQYAKKKRSMENTPNVPKKTITRIIDLFVKYESRFAEKMQKFEEEITEKLDAGLKKGIETNSSRFLIKAIEIPAEEYSDKDRRLALATAFKNNFSDWILYKVKHVEGKECTRESGGDCCKSCAYALMMTVKWRDCVKSSGWDSVDLEDEDDAEVIVPKETTVEENEKGTNV